MVNRNLIRELDLGDELEQELDLAMGGSDAADFDVGQAPSLAINSVVEGKILRVDDEFVLVDVGYKSEGHIPRNEWDETEPGPEVGDVIKVLLEDIEENIVDEHRGLITLSKRKARRIEDWLRVMSSVREDDVVTGFVLRKIKGGLLVDIAGVNVFLPASQVDIRRPADIGDYCDRAIQCLVLKIDEARRNIVVSRRALIEQERSERKKQLMETLEVGQVRRGIVKNIADFGAFVDLGGIDGLLHITDMAWKRVRHPSELINIGDEIDVKVLKFDKEKTRVSLGLKQLNEDPWFEISKDHPEGSKLKGKITNIADYGCFVEIHNGVEGLVHVSEMDWTNKNANP